MDCGAIVERASPESLLRDGQHERTRALLAAMPTMEPLGRAATMGGA
jgi:ABC-type oligopeptide transport system ATPase subunit